MLEMCGNEIYSPRLDLMLERGVKQWISSGTREDNSSPLHVLGNWILRGTNHTNRTNSGTRGEVSEGPTKAKMEAF